MSKVIKEFSRFAHQYNAHNMIQAQVAKRLVSKLSSSAYGNILDLGCGSGEVFKNLQTSSTSFQMFTALDSSQSMLDLHPQTGVVTKVCANFNEKDFLHTLPRDKYDLLISASAIQWSEDLDFTLKALSSLCDKAYMAIFTSGTFATLHKVGNVSSPIYSAKVLEEKIEKYYENVHFELHTYTLHFDSVRDMFRYIKKSGVSTGEKKLGFKETKSLMKNYPLDYLEFEVLFVEAKNV